MVAGLLLGQVVGPGCGGVGGAARGDPPKAAPGSRSTSPVAQGAPLVELEPLASYLAGGPMLMRITVTNRDRDRFYTGLPTLDWVQTSSELQWTLRPVGATAVVISDGVLHDEGGGGQSLGHAERLSMLVDLSALAPDLEPGQYEVRVGYPVDDFVPSAWVRFEVVAASDVEAAALRTTALAAGVRPTQGWGSFLSTVPGATLPSIEALPDRVRTQLAVHLLVQRACYGTADLEDLSLEPLAFITDDTLEGEREALRYELLRAREDPSAHRVRRSIESKWPGLRYRLDAVDGGYGFLEVQREQAQRRRATKRGD